MNRLLIISFALVLLLSGCDEGTTYSSPSPTKSPPSPRRWYEGGTLMNSTLGEWKLAPYKNRLATAADMVTSMLQHDGKLWKTLDELRWKAVQLEACVSETAAASELSSMASTEVSASCYILMNW